MSGRRIGIIGAMAPEIEALRNTLQEPVQSEAAGMTFWEGRIGRMPVVLVRSGIGKVNAAVCTQILIDRFQVTHILNTGIAGSLNEEIDIGDAVVSTDAVYHDVDATYFGYQPGQVPQLSTFAFPADPAFSKEVKEALKTASEEIHVYSGRVVSGDSFVIDQKTKDRIRDVFHGYCVEMEGAAIAHTAWLNQIPFVIVRFISDKANEESIKTYDEIEEEASMRSARMTSEVLRRMEE